MSLSYRALTVADVDAYRDLRLLGLRLFPENFLDDHQDKAEQPRDVWVETVMQGMSRGVFDVDRLVAMTATLWKQPQRVKHRAELGGFLVHPEAHGTGVAQFLMDAVIAEARQRGVWQMELYVNADNARGRRFYERNGFREVGLLPNSIIVDGVAQNDLFMTRDLRA